MLRSAFFFHNTLYITYKYTIDPYINFSSPKDPQIFLHGGLLLRIIIVVNNYHDKCPRNANT